MAEIIDKGSALKVIRDANTITYYNKLDSNGDPILFATVNNNKFLLSAFLHSYYEFYNLSIF